MNSRARVLLLVCLSVTVYGCSSAHRPDDKSWKDCFDAGTVAMQSRNFAQAEVEFKDAVEGAKAFEKGDIRLPRTYDSLGAAYMAVNEIEDAKRAYTNAYNEYKSRWNPKGNDLSNRDVALGLSTDALHLANIACDALRLDEAERMYDEALSVEEAALGSDTLKGQILEGKMKLYKLTGRGAEAEKLKEQLTELKSLPSVDDTANMSWKQLNEAGNDAFAAGNLAKAEKIYNDGIRRAKKPSQVAESMRGLARILDQQKEFEKALAKLSEARAILRTDEHRWELADNLNLAGFCYLSLKQYTNSEKMFTDALKALDVKERGDADRCKVSYEGLTRAYSEEGKYADAEKNAREKLVLTTSLSGKKDERYAENLLAVTILQAKQKKNEEAQKGFQAVIALEEGSPSPRCMLAALDAYAKFLRETKQDALADSIELKAKNLRAEFE